MFSRNSYILIQECKVAVLCFIIFELTYNSHTMKFTHHEIHPLKVYSAMVFNNEVYSKIM